ncbi:MAG: sigma-70 family RNA polymerase sigma factor [Bryobacteraceae bacterium]|jgi:RNA polymerase sigma factor for flagellar operon FliA
MPAVARASPDELAERHLSLVIHIARDFKQRLPPGVSFDDLVGAGNLGLVEAARRFNPAKGASFSTFARHRIRGAITDSLRGIDPVSRGLRSQQKAAERAIFDLAAAKQRPPTEREIADRLKLRLGDWRKLSRTLYEAGCPLNRYAPGATGPTELDRVPSRWPDPEQLAAIAELRAGLTEATETLPPRYRNVIRLYHFDGWTMKQIGTQLGVNESRVSQIHSSAMRRLRERAELRKRA